MAARLHPAPDRHQRLSTCGVFPRGTWNPCWTRSVAAWRNELEWDFEKSADLVRRFVDLSALNGSALVEDGEVAGYMYYVLEEDKGLIGDLYVRRRYARSSAKTC